MTHTRVNFTNKYILEHHRTHFTWSSFIFPSKNICEMNYNGVLFIWFGSSSTAFNLNGIYTIFPHISHQLQKKKKKKKKGSPFKHSFNEEINYEKIDPTLRMNLSMDYATTADQRGARVSKILGEYLFTTILCRNARKGNNRPVQSITSRPWEPIRETLSGKSSGNAQPVGSARWAIVDWSWPKKKKGIGVRELISTYKSESVGGEWIVRSSPENPHKQGKSQHNHKH